MRLIQVDVVEKHAHW